MKSAQGTRVAPYDFDLVVVQGSIQKIDLPSASQVRATGNTHDSVLRKVQQK